MTIITRRAALRGIASIPALGGATAALAFERADTNETPILRMQRLWAAFCAALEGLTPSDCRLQISGSHLHGRPTPSLHVMSARKTIEDVGGLTIRVEHTADEFWSYAPGELVRYES